MPKLLAQVRTVIRTRHYSFRKEQTYIHWIKQYIFFNSKRHQLELGRVHYLWRAVDQELLVFEYFRYWS